MNGRLAGKVALIIGAARGIGAGIAERFHEEGARVVIADTEVEAGAATAERLKGEFVATDISKPADAEGAVVAALAAFGDLHIVVQNAGIFPWSLIEDISPEEWDRVLGVNLRGVFLIARAALPHMKAKRYGRMVFTSSITGPRVTSPGHGHYSASKAGINGFIKVGGAGILVLQHHGQRRGAGQHPDREHREAAQQSLHPEHGGVHSSRSLGTPRDVAQAALFLASDEAAYITGTTIVVDGGQILPEGKDFRLGPA